MAQRDDAVRLTLVKLQEAAAGVAVAEMKRAPTTDAVVEMLPQIVAYYADGSAALAADYYDDLRDDANAVLRFTAEPVVDIDEVKVRNAAAWAAEPLRLVEPDEALSAARLAEVITLRTAEPFRDTVTENRRRDPAAVGWRRYVSGKGCAFCRMLADRGAVYKAETARFASHGNCSCTASPVFDPQAEEASTLQYVASKRNRSAAEQIRLREYLNARY